MKAEKVFDAVIGLMFSEKRDKSDFESMFYPILNVIISECFDANNILRGKKGLEKLTDIPFVESEHDDIPYEDEIMRATIPYGVAANLYSEDDINGITNVYREKYLMLLKEIAYAEFKEAEE